VGFLSIQSPGGRLDPLLLSGDGFAGGRPLRNSLSFQLYRKEADCHRVSLERRQTGQPSVPYAAKTELAVNLVLDWQPPEGTEPYVLADSWYVCDELFKACEKRKFTLIGGLSANRKISTAAHSALIALTDYARLLPKEAYQLVTLKKQTYRLAGVEARLKGGRTIKVVVGGSLTVGTKPGAGIKHYTYRYFVSSDPHLSVSTISEFYSVRWEIETFHAVAKELLGLDHNQCWRERSVQRLWTLLLIAYSYLVVEQVEHCVDYAVADQTRVSLGQVAAQHKREAHRGQAEWVYQQALAGQPLRAGAYQA
jgi:hypothetical protein